VNKICFTCYVNKETILHWIKKVILCWLCFSPVVQKQTLGEWETEWLFDGQLCQEYSYQKLSKSDNWFSNVGDVFFATQCKEF